METLADVIAAQKAAVEAYENGNKDYAKSLFFLICQENCCLHSAEVLVNLLCAEPYNIENVNRLIQLRDLLLKSYDHKDSVVLIMLAQIEFRLASYYQDESLRCEQRHRQVNTNEYRATHARVTELMNLGMCAWKNSYMYILMLCGNYNGHEATPIRGASVLQLLQERFPVDSIAALAKQIGNQIHEKYPVSASRIIKLAKQEATANLLSAPRNQGHKRFVI